jgi:putative peptidoglycan lipid II flippase
MSERRRLALSTAIVSVLSLSGKVLAVTKTFIIAALFGTSGSLDAFWVAYLLPTVLPEYLKGILSTAFIPRFMKSLAGESDTANWRGANTLFTVMLLLMFTFSLVAMLFTPWVVKAVAPGLTDSVHQQAVAMTRVMLVGTIFLTLSTILTILAHCHHRFTVASLDGVVTNIVIIAGIMFFARDYGINALVFSVVAGFAAQTLMLLVANRRLVADRLRPALALRHPDFHIPLRHMVPMAVGYLGALGVALADQIFVSYLPPGAISALNYAVMIAILPVEVFAQAVMTTFFPTLSRQAAQSNGRDLIGTHAQAIRVLVLLILPCAGFFMLYADVIVALLFKRGNFTQESADLTASVLVFLAIGILSRAIAYFNYRVLQAMSRPWTQVRIGLLGVVTNVILNAVLIAPLGLKGIALASSVAFTQSALMSLWIVEKHLKAPVVRDLILPLGKIVAVAIAFLAAAELFGAVLMFVFDPHDAVIKSICQLGGAVPAAVVAFWAGVQLKLDEVTVMLRIMQRRWRLKGAT